MEDIQRKCESSSYGRPSSATPRSIERTMNYRTWLQEMWKKPRIDVVVGSELPCYVHLFLPPEVTLLNCKPKTAGALTQEAADRYRGKVRRMTEAKGAELVDYDPKTGVWAFRVNHF